MLPSNSSGAGAPKSGGPDNGHEKGEAMARVGVRLTDQLGDASLICLLGMAPTRLPCGLPTSH